MPIRTPGGLHITVAPVLHPRISRDGPLTTGRDWAVVPFVIQARGQVLEVDRDRLLRIRRRGLLPDEPTLAVATLPRLHDVLASVKTEGVLGVSPKSSAARAVASRAVAPEIHLPIVDERETVLVRRGRRRGRQHADGGDMLRRHEGHRGLQRRAGRGRRHLLHDNALLQRSVVLRDEVEPPPLGEQSAVVLTLTARGPLALLEDEGGALLTLQVLEHLGLQHNRGEKVN